MEHGAETEPNPHALAQLPGLCERFEVLEVLGDGAAGFVYRVHDRHRNNREVALKVLANELAFDEATIDRFIQELRVCQQLRHVHIVEAYDLITFDDTVAFTMEFVAGKSLAELFEHRRLTYDEIDKFFIQLLDAVQALHENGVVHRDIKLENILIRNDGVVKLGDLGLIKKLDREDFTKTGILLGTAQYMPPEYIRESEYDERGDIYALGLVLYELLTGKRWLSHLKGNEAINYLLKTKFHVARESLAGIPPKYLEILSRALEMKPRERYQTAREMRQTFLRPIDTPMAVPGSIEIRERLRLDDVSLRTSTYQKPKRSPVIFVAAIVIGMTIGMLLRAFLPTARPALPAIAVPREVSEPLTVTVESKAKPAKKPAVKQPAPKSK